MTRPAGPPPTDIPDGLLSTRRCRATGTVVSVYDAEKSGIECDPTIPWATVCEDHGGIVCHATLALARSWAADPVVWCPGCQSKDAERTKDRLEGKPEFPC